MNLLPPYKKIFAIIVTYNGKQWINTCLKSLVESNYPVSVIAVDNGSSDDSVKIIKEAFKAVHLFEERKNLGFGQANNKGVSFALKQGADYVFLLNQDAWVEPDTIGNLIETDFNTRGFGIISPLHLTGSGKELDAGFRNSISKSLTQEEISRLMQDKPGGIREVQFINAAAWMISREALQKVGGFNPLFHHYGEDLELANRVRFHNYKIGFVSNCSIYHDRETRDAAKTFSDRKTFTWYYCVGVKARLVNVAKPLTRCLVEMIFWTGKECFFYSIKGRWFAPISWFEIWYLILQDWRGIRQSRQLIKSSAPFLFLPTDLE